MKNLDRNVRVLVVIGTINLIPLLLGLIIGLLVYPRIMLVGGFIMLAGFITSAVALTVYVRRLWQVIIQIWITYKFVDILDRISKQLITDEERPKKEFMEVFAVTRTEAFQDTWTVMNTAVTSRTDNVEKMVKACRALLLLQNHRGNDVLAAAGIDPRIVTRRRSR